MIKLSRRVTKANERFALATMALNFLVFGLFAAYLIFKSRTDLMSFTLVAFAAFFVVPATIWFLSYRKRLSCNAKADLWNERVFKAFDGDSNG